MKKLTEKTSEHFKKHNMEYQFWLYETGNVNAAIAGTGGYTEFSDNLYSVANNVDLDTIEKISTLISQYPDATTAIGIGGITVLTPALKNASNIITTKLDNVIDLGSTLGATGLLAYAITQDTSWITVSASSFVVGSSLLRYSANNPFFLKMGGLALGFGGMALSAFGIETGLSVYSNPEILNHMTDYKDTIVETARLSLPILTVTSGAYIAASSLYKYEGGIYASQDFNSNSLSDKKSWVSKLTAPHTGWLAQKFEQYLDSPIKKINDFTKRTMLFYLPKEMKDEKPFLTGMWAKLPQRVLFGSFSAIASQSLLDPLLISNLQWSGGDGMIGLEDCKENDKKNSETNTYKTPKLNFLPVDIS